MLKSIYDNKKIDWFVGSNYNYGVLFVVIAFVYINMKVYLLLEIMFMLVLLEWRIMLFGWW